MMDLLGVVGSDLYEKIEEHVQYYYCIFES
jgi:hypothetical protein